VTRAVLTVLLSVTLAACAGSLFKNKIPPPTMYMLSAGTKPAAADSSPGNPSPTDLAVLRPRVRAGLDTDRIAALYPDRRMDYFANVRWSGPLDEVIQDLAVQEIHTNPGLRNVSADISVFSSAYWLEIEIIDFQAEYPASGGPPTVHVHLQARLGSSSDRRVIARFEPNIYEPAADNRMTAIVDAYNHAADKALAEIGLGAAQALAAK
jgi:cholesterol transport system auxiliary component